MARSVSSPPFGLRSRVGFMPTRPQQAAGIRIDPSPSLAWATGTMPDATAAAYDGEWYKTGDMLKCNEEGFYFFSDRKKDAVRYKGRNISTFEVELAARKHPAIADCAAFGIASEELESEQEIMLDVILKPGKALQAIELAQYINDNAPYFFVPRYIQFVDSLPYTPTNKVQKFLLREGGVTSDTWDARVAGFRAHR